MTKYAVAEAVYAQPVRPMYHMGCILLPVVWHACIAMLADTRAMALAANIRVFVVGAALLPKAATVV
jgi:hypothetical protein